MNQKSKLTLEDLAASQKLALEYTAELPPQLPGMLDGRPDPTYIAVNNTQPVYEQRFCIGSALGRYYLPRHWAVRPPWYHSPFNRRWNNHYMRLWMRGARRWFNRNFNQQKQSELFALNMLMTLGYKDDLRLYFEKHPEMIKWAVCLTFISVARGLKQRLVSVVKRLFTMNSALP
jgi:hypothetical protein